MHLVPNYYNNIENIGEESIIVEIDESKFEKKNVLSRTCC